jgi:N-acetylmuramoyl-L-alanine amidase
MADPAPVSVNSPNALDLQFILVTVRTDFLGKKEDGTGILFHWRSGGGGHGSPDSALGNGEAISGATVDLLRPNGVVVDSNVTDRQGHATLETSQLADGDYTVRIKPKDLRPDPAGPAIAEDDKNLPQRMYNALEVHVKLSQGSIKEATIDGKIKFAGLGNRIQTKWPPETLPTDHLPIDLKPIWMLGYRAVVAASRRIQDIKLIVVHNTSSDSAAVATIGSDLNTFISAPEPGNYSDIHYMIDLNGHVIKFMKDKTVAFHAGGSWKHGESNQISIGIEIVHKESGVHEYTPDQYSALLDLIARLHVTYPFDPTQITGHSDVGTQAHPQDRDLLNGNRDNDPGEVFRWENLELQRWGMIPRDVPLGDAYSKFFTASDDVMLQEGDRDGQPAIHADKKHKQERPPIPGTPILEVQNDLARIGYSVKNRDGHYSHYTDRAVAAFQRHFFSGNRRRSDAEKARTDGKVDKATAQMIKNVLAGLPAPTPAPTPVPKPK